MNWSNSEFDEACEQLLIPLFEGVDRAPNNSLSGLGRSQRNLVKEAISSDEFEGKKGQRMVVWTPGCRVMLIGMRGSGVTTQLAKLKKKYDVPTLELHDRYKEYMSKEMTSYDGK